MTKWEIKQQQVTEIWYPNINYLEFASTNWMQLKFSIPPKKGGMSCCRDVNSSVPCSSNPFFEIKLSNSCWALGHLEQGYIFPSFKTDQDILGPSAANEMYVQTFYVNWQETSSKIARMPHLLPDLHFFPQALWLNLRCHCGWWVEAKCWRWWSNSTENTDTLFTMDVPEPAGD